MHVYKKLGDVRNPLAGKQINNNLQTMAHNPRNINKQIPNAQHNTHPLRIPHGGIETNQCIGQQQ